MSQKYSVSKTLTITLDEREQNLKRMLIDVASWLDRLEPQIGNNGEMLPTVLRFTGGWVRDKLLNIPSHDIDIAINNRTGQAFSTRMVEFLEQSDNMKKYGLQKIHNLHDIKANPEKSKNLETVHTVLNGLELDFVNLRKEIYDDTSRIPQIEATSDAEEDAIRRDATINAMFYNLQEDKVEDLTKRGFDDLHAGIIRTPIDPLKTFRDDPLRILRLIRFAGRYGFQIDKTTKSAMMNDESKVNLQRKISRERVGIELEKMLKGPHPILALSLIDELGLYYTVFSAPEIKNDFRPDASSWSLNYDTLQHLLDCPSSQNQASTEHDNNLKYVRGILLNNEDSEYTAWVLACFVPYADAPQAQPSKAGGKQPPSLASVVAREGIKAPNKVSDLVEVSMQNFGDILGMKDAFIKNNRIRDVPDPRGRDVLGNAIRQWGKTWRSQAIFSYLIDVERAHTFGRDVLKEWSMFLEHLTSQQLLDVYELKPIINGTEICKAMNLRPGPWIKEALEVVITWQLRNPEGATIDAAISAVTESFENSQGKESLQCTGKPGSVDNRDKEVQHIRQKRHLVEHDKNEANTGELAALLIRKFLSHTIRPLFSKTTPLHHQETITSSGRAKAPQPFPTRKHEPLDSEEKLTRPWKSRQDRPSLDLLQWCITHLTPSMTESQWPLLIPPILTLLDDTETQYRALGAKLLASLLFRTPPSLLSRTGLSDVFREALSPSLHYLPTLTPESESILLLKEVYGALFKLITVQHAEDPARASHSLSTVLHENLLPSLSHIDPPWSYPALTASLLSQVCEIIQKLGLDAIREAQYILPVTKAVVGDNPFACDSLDGLRCMKSGVTLLKILLANIWMRAHMWRGEVIDILTSGWVRIVEAEEQRKVEDQEDSMVEEMQIVKSEMPIAVRILVAGVEASSLDAGEQFDFDEEIRAIVKADDRLKDLFNQVDQA